MVINAGLVNGITILQVLKKFMPGAPMGEDKEGHPVWYCQFSYDFRGKYIHIIIHVEVGYKDSLHVFYCCIFESVILCFYRTTLFSEVG